MNYGNSSSSSSNLNPVERDRRGRVKPPRKKLGHYVTLHYIYIYTIIQSVFFNSICASYHMISYDIIFLQTAKPLKPLSLLNSNSNNSNNNNNNENIKDSNIRNVITSHSAHVRVR